MAKISTYAIQTPKPGDIITGTDTDPALNNPTKNFTVQSIVDLANGGGGGTPTLYPVGPNILINIDLLYTNPLFTSIYYGAITDWDVSQVTNMSEAFSPLRTDISGLGSFNEDISGWDVSSVTDMDYMFAYAQLFNQPIGNWNTSSVKDMRHMFDYAKAFNQDIGSWDVSSVADMNGLFRNASAFNGNIGAWSVSNVDNMQSMFDGATAFNQDISGWDVSNVTKMYGMFTQATSFDQPLNWDVSSVTNMNYMFRDATSFDQPLNWDVSSVTEMYSMFQGVNLSTVNYDLTLVAWENSLEAAFPGGVGYTPNISVNFNSAKYTAGSAAETARTSLVNTFGWNITDGGSI